MTKVTLTISCPDQVGLVAAVSDYLANKHVSISEANHHTDHTVGWFFMRHEINFNEQQISFLELKAGFEKLAGQFDMKWTMVPASEKTKVILFASKESHCLTDVLHRWHENELDCDIVAVVANHKEMEKYATWYQVPFHFVNFAEGKENAFFEIEKIVDGYQANTIVLARFMQILPESLCQKYNNQVINIHHSFLPSFVGAKPYHQAYDRGVKLIGATCHYVTTELDAGPIIEQDIRRISHSDTIEDMVLKGKDCERQALARGLKYHLEHRVMVHGNKTVVFSN